MAGRGGRTQRGKPLTPQTQKSKQTKSTLRVPVEHILGAQANDMGGTLVRTIGVASGSSNRRRDP